MTSLHYHRYIALLLLFVFSVSARAEIYTCEQNGKKVFSQLPCGESAERVSVQGERDIDIRTDMSPVDVNNFCQMVISSWKKSDMGNNPYEGYSYGRYRSRSSSYSERAQTYVLSHIRNLTDLANNAPEVYDTVVDMAESYSYNVRGDKYTYEGEKARIMDQCRGRLVRALRSVPRMTGPRPSSRGLIEQQQKRDAAAAKSVATDAQ